MFDEPVTEPTKAEVADVGKWSKPVVCEADKTDCTWDGVGAPDAREAV